MVSLANQILVLGAGNFGTCLADHLASLGNNVTLWARDPTIVQSINSLHTNCKYLVDVPLTKTLKATSELCGGVVSSHSCIVFAIPSQHLRQILKQIKNFIHKEHLLIFVNKGIEKGSLLLPCDVINQEIGSELGSDAVFLSGPSFAAEVVRREITCVAVASKSSCKSSQAQEIFHAPHFRVYCNDDVIGLEAAGALKNVMALASGACAGLGLQANARAAMLTRALAEITRIGVKLGANPLTFQGLSGVGDLFLTCTSEKSRNFTVGYRIGKGEKLDHVLATLGSIAEGVETAAAAYELCKNLQVDSPIINGVYAVLYENAELMDIFKGLITRDPKKEFEY